MNRHFRQETARIRQTSSELFLYIGNIGSRLYLDQPMTMRERETTSTSDSHAIAQLTFEADEGPELAYRIERFGK
jgi:hypothetical protein